MRIKPKDTQEVVTNILIMLFRDNFKVLSADGAKGVMIMYKDGYLFTIVQPTNDKPTKTVQDKI
jgi:hypothetical protein